MTKLPTPNDLEVLAARAGLSMAEVSRRAGINKGVFNGWRAGKGSPRLAGVQALLDVLSEALNDKENNNAR